MDVPFHSSNAMSRAHYAIVRKVETASSHSSADQDLFLEIRSIEGQLADPKLSLAKCKECLVILLYCSTSATPGFLPVDAFEFAFHHAINLAETGKRVEDKRIGYLFCAEIMPLDHELRLMLINTLRKDLESSEIPRICLALDNLISSPTEDVIPAVQSRLHDLLSHDYSYVRRRALFAFRALSKHNAALLERIHGSVLKRLKDPDASVLQAALIIAHDMSTDKDVVDRVNEVFVAESAYINTGQDIMLSAVKALRSLSLSKTNASILLDILKEHCTQKKPSIHSKAVILEIFLLLSQLDISLFMAIEKKKNTSAIRCIRHLLTSRDPNDVHLFMTCLECIDVSAWAGTTPDKSAALDGAEFEHIMRLLNSDDEAFRKKTLRIIKRVDTAILDGHVEALLKNAAVEPTSIDIALLRIMEATFVRHEEDGGEYARQVLDVLRKVEQAHSEPRVFKGVIEAILTDIRIPQTPDFVSSCATHFVTVLSEPDVPLGPTALIIATALATEFTGSVSTSPLEVLAGLASRVRACPAIVQEPCMIAMLRVRAECDEVPANVIEAITTLSQNARRSIRSWCTEFLGFSQNKDALLTIIREAESPSLPDFLVALQRHRNKVSRSEALEATSTPQYSRTSSRTSTHASASLRYDAYATPEAIPSLRTRRPSSSSAFGSPRTTSSHTDASNVSSPSMTAGHLALAAGIEELQIHNPQKSSSLPPVTGISTTSRPDLISLGSPFEDDNSKPLDLSETRGSEYNFENTWNQLNSACDLRGWCKSSTDMVIRRLQRVDGHHLRVISSDVEPFIGELKVLVVPNDSARYTTTPRPIAFRLRESEDDSCLWRLRCTDDGVGKHMQSVLGA